MNVVQQSWSAMMAVLLAKFILNDVPHAIGLFDNPSNPTPKTKYRVELEHRDPSIAAAQKRSGAVHEQYIHAYSREQGKLLAEQRNPGYVAISALEASSGSNPKVRVEETTVDKIIDDLERTWHRIDSDMSIRMQEALGILKEVMSYHYEQEAIVVWDNSNLIGIAVYETILDKDLGVQDTHISELASFTHKPGIGKLLVEKIIKIAKEEGSDAVTASYAAGYRGFYEKLGFVKDYRYPEAPTLLMYRVKSGNPLSVKLYHCTATENVDSIMKDGLLSSESASGMTFFFPNLQVAKEAGISGMAILEVSITDDEVDKCIIGETFPDLYIERYGGEPPADMTLREYIRNPIAYGIPEVCCTMDRIPADRIKYAKAIRR